MLGIPGSFGVSAVKKDIESMTCKCVDLRKQKFGKFVKRGRTGLPLRAFLRSFSYFPLALLDLVLALHLFVSRTTLAGLYVMMSENRRMTIGF